MGQTKKHIAKTTNAMMRGIIRKELIESGMYGVFKQKSIPSKKGYTRKGKNKKAYLEA